MPPESQGFLLKLAEQNGPMALAILFLGVMAALSIRFIFRPLGVIFKDYVISPVTAMEEKRKATADKEVEGRIITQETAKIQLKIAETQERIAKSYEMFKHE